MPEENVYLIGFYGKESAAGVKNDEFNVLVDYFADFRHKSNVEAGSFAVCRYVVERERVSADTDFNRFRAVNTRNVGGFDISEVIGFNISIDKLVKLSGIFQTCDSVVYIADKFSVSSSLATIVRDALPLLSRARISLFFFSMYLAVDSKLMKAPST